MALNNNAYTRFVNVYGQGTGEGNLVNQSSPSWVLTFVRWDIRDTYRTSGSPTAVRTPLVVQNDCIQLSVTTSKNTLTPNMAATLIMTDTNYETAISPGDFVFVNILNWENATKTTQGSTTQQNSTSMTVQKGADQVALQAQNLQPINGENDGFKGIFKVQSVRKSLSVNPESGVKSLVFKITGFAFTEFNNSIYFNPYLIDDYQKLSKLYIDSIGKFWALITNKNGNSSLQAILKTLIDNLIGSGISDNPQNTQTNTQINYNTHFIMPSQIGSLLGVSNVTAAKDIYNYLFGIQSYIAGSSTSLANGMNPIVSNSGRYWNTPNPCKGIAILKAEYWNQVQLWSIMKQYTNSPLNELYSCFRISKNGGVMPTIVFRQMPFTNDDFASTTGINAKVTLFSSLPRWKINPAMIYSIDLGRDEAARVNFVQYFGRSIINQGGWEISQEVSQGNFAYDQDDVTRNGLRPYVTVSQFDEIANTQSNSDGASYASTTWAQIVGDALIGGHLKMNGSLECMGIVDPIAVGDNLDFDDVIYHIEQITHNCYITKGEDGKAFKVFRTSVRLSNGISKQTNSQGLAYPEMYFSQANDLRQNDYDNNQLLPGVSEGQSTIHRTQNVDVPDTIVKNNPFSEPQSNDKPEPGDDTNG